MKSQEDRRRESLARCKAGLDPDPARAISYLLQLFSTMELEIIAVDLEENRVKEVG